MQPQITNPFTHNLIQMTTQQLIRTQHLMRIDVPKLLKSLPQNLFKNFCEALYSFEEDLIEFIRNFGFRITDSHMFHADRKMEKHHIQWVTDTIFEYVSKILVQKAFLEDDGGHQYLHQIVKYHNNEVSKFVQE